MLQRGREKGAICGVLARMMTRSPGAAQPHLGLSSLWRSQWPAVIAPFLVSAPSSVVVSRVELIGVHRTSPSPASRSSTSGSVGTHVLPDDRDERLRKPRRERTVRSLSLFRSDRSVRRGNAQSDRLVVTNLAALVALGFLYAWISESFDDRTARRAVQIALVFPTSFFLTAAYSESVYLVAAVGATLAWSRKQPWPAALAVVAGCLARPVGVLSLTFPFVIQWVATDRRIRTIPWFVAASALGAGLVLLIYHAATGDALAFLHAPQTESLGKYVGEHHVVHAPAILWDEGWSQNLMRRFSIGRARALIRRPSFTSCANGASMALLRRCRLRCPFAFQRSLLDAASMGRYALVGFPVFLALARWVPTDRGTSSTRAFVVQSCWRSASTARWAE
jgi:lipid-A-disaccharide synthase-like uncharacterized protein